jgi:hypothetical protein|nr:hypothetical protein [Candidatus Acidoferrales bacterium]
MRSRWLAAILAVVFATFVSGAAFAQKHEHHWDEHHPVFDDHEHEVVNTWWGTHRDHPLIGFRVEDRLPADWEPRLQVGFVLDAGWRRRMHPLPADLIAELPPPPPHFVYEVIGAHVVLVDRRDWHVADVININL